MIIPAEYVDFVRLIGDPIFVVEGSGVIVSANPAFAQALQQDQQRLVGQRLSELAVDPADKIRRSLRFCSRTRDPIFGALSLRKADGAILKFPYRGMLLRPRTNHLPALMAFQLERSKEFIDLNTKICDLAREVHQRQGIEKALRQSEKSWRDSFNALEDVMLIVNADYTVRKINSKGLELFGKTEDEIIGKKCYQVVHGTDQPDEFCPFKETLKTGKPALIRDRYEGAFNKYFTIKSSPIFNEVGKIAGFVDLVRDVTERKRAQEALQMRRKQLLESGPTRNVAIVGGGPGCKAIMDIIFAETLSQLPMKLIGVASRNPKALGYLYAQEKRIYTTTHYRDLYKLKELHMIIELTGSDEVAHEIAQTKPKHIRLMDHVAALLFWDVFHIEEERIAGLRRLEAERIAAQRRLEAERIAARKRAEEALQMRREQLFEEVPERNVAIVGGGPGCKAIMDIIFAETLSQLRMKLIGVASRNPKAVGYLYAREKGIYTTTHYRDLYKLKDLHMIIELTGSDNVAHEIAQTKPAHVKLMDHVAALLFWDVFFIEEQRIDTRRQIDEEKIAARKRAEEVLHMRRAQLLEGVPTRNVAIVGGGPGCKAIMDIIFAETLSQLRMKLIGVASRNPKAVGYLYAREKGIYTTTHYRDLYRLKDLHMIIELTGSDEVAHEIARTKPAHINLMDHVAALLFWDVFHIEEQRITERRRSEEATKLAHTELRQIFETSADGMRVIGRDFNLLRVNKTFARMAGMMKEDISGKKCYDIFPGPLCHTAECPMIRLLGGEEAVECEVEKERCDGTKISCIVAATPFQGPDGELIGIVEDFRDISERKQSEEALRESEEKFRALVESSIDGIVVVQENKIVFANQKTLEMFGYDSADDMVGQVFTTFVSPKYHDMIIQWGIAKEKGQNVPSRYEFKALRKSGAEFDAELSLSTITYQGHLASQGVVRDVTESKLADKEKERLEFRLQQAQRMEAVGSLAGGVAHDLNNILSGIVSYPDLMLMRIPEDSPLRKPISTMKESGKKAAFIVQDLLTLARRGLATTEVANLNDIISEYLISPEHQKLKLYHPDVEVQTHLEMSLLNILGSPVHLSKTVMNLVSNAAEAMAVGGNILISTENRYVDRPIRGYDEVEEGDYVMLTVSDTGVGIPSEEIGRIFEPFFTKKKLGRSGTGLGMAVVWSTVKDHNGYINVQSAEGQGTTFTLYFPATRQQLVKGQSPLNVQDYMGNGQSILVVDDVREQREIAFTILSELGYSVTTVSSGEEAVEHMQKNAVDLLLLDMIMDPGIDGLDTYKKILQLHPGQKAIIASGFSETHRVKEAQRLGAREYVKKPYTLEKIGVVVKAELEK